MRHETREQSSGASLLVLQVTVNPLHVDQCPANGKESEIKGGAGQAARTFAQICQRGSTLSQCCAYCTSSKQRVCVWGGAQSQLCVLDCNHRMVTAGCMCVGRGEGIQYYAESSTNKSSPLAVEIKLPVKTNTKGPISIEPQVGRTDVAPCVHLPCTDLHNLYKPMAWLKLDCCKQTAYACLEHPCELVIPNLQVAIQ